MEALSTGGSQVQENIDGATNDNSNGVLGYPPSPDSVAEFKVVLNPYDASYGRAGAAAIDITLKSGTNKLHGALYEFARRPWLDANLNSYNTLFYQYNVSTNQCPAVLTTASKGCLTPPLRSAHKRDQFGAELDGPVFIPHLYNGKDKTFFTLSWEQVYEDVPSGGLSTKSIPSAAELNGDFSKANYIYTYAKPDSTKGINLQNICLNQQPVCPLPLGIYDPTKAVTSVLDANDNTTKDQRQQFGSNNCGDMSGRAITCLIPLQDQGLGKAVAGYIGKLTPNYDPGPLYAANQNNFAFQPLEHDYVQNGLVKIDHNFGSADRGTIRWEGFVRYSADLVNGIDPTSPINQKLNNIQPKDNNYSLEEIHTFSPNMILDNKLTLLNERQNRSYGISTPGILATLGFSQNYQSNSNHPNYFPAININDNPGVIELGPGSTTNSNPPNSNNIYHLLAYQPSITYLHGRHSFRFGLDMRLSQYANPGGGNNAAAQNLTYNRGFTQQYVGSKSDATGFTSGSGLADLLLGYPASASISYSTDPFYSQHYFAPWLQDDWKITSKLTLNLGVRWDILTPRTERHNKVDVAFDSKDISPLDAQLTSHVGFNGPLMGGIRIAGVNGNPRGAYNTNWHNVQPSVGFAYAFTSKTSLRGGFAEKYINNEDANTNLGFTSNRTSYNSALTDIGSGVITDNTYPTPALTYSGRCTGTQCPTAENPFALGYAKPAFLCGSTTCTNVNGSPISLSDELLGQVGGNVSFDNPNLIIPSIWTFSASLAQLITRRDALEISYSGTKGYNLLESIDLNHDSAAWNARCDISRGGNAALCNASTQGPSRAPNPFVNLPAFAGTGQGALIGTNVFTRPFPQFGSVTENGLPNVHSWYNSMQVQASHNVSKSLNMRAAFTWSKSMKAGQTVDLVNGVKGRSLSSSDTPIVITFTSVYYVPIGRGKALLGNTNRLVDALVGGWEISPLYIYSSGKPQASNSNWQYISTLRVPLHDLPIDAAHPSTVRTRGITPCGAVRVDPNIPGALDFGAAYTNAGCTAPAAIQLPSFSIGRNVIYSGVRSAAIHEFDASISKHFAWNERANLQVRVDVFNILNHRSFNSGYNTTWDSIDYGTYNKTGDGAYPPRELQLSGKITF